MESASLRNRPRQVAWLPALDYAARVKWDPSKYLQFSVHRSRPFFELLARVGAEDPSLVVDLGCGPGTLTATLAERWPGARVVGVDSSAEMVRAARERAVPRLELVEADIRSYEPDATVDVLVSNAALHWVPEHLELLPRLAGFLSPGGWLAFQIPANFAEPSHAELDALVGSERWRDKLGGLERPGSHDAGDYLDVLARQGLGVDVWETRYLQVLHGDDPVLEWMKGTALRPVLSRLDESEAQLFVEQCAERLRRAYPSASYGTVLPYRRVFAVAHREG